MSAASTGQHHGSSLHVVQQATIQHLDATAASVFHSQLGHPYTAAMQQAFPFFDAFPQYIYESASGLVLYV
jgi:hypothetical protein